MIPIILIQAIKLLTDFLYPPAALYRKKWYFHILLFTARQVGVYITLSVVLRGTSAAKISRAFLCTFLCHQPYRFLCRGGIHAACLPLNPPYNLPSPYKSPGHARPLPHIFFHALTPTHFINILLQPPRSKNAPQGYFSVQDTKRPARTVLPPDAAPSSCFPGKQQ